jgi:polyhydroxybutyrate depolymerase
VNCEHVPPTVTRLALLGLAAVACLTGCDRRDASAPTATAPVATTAAGTGAGCRPTAVEGRQSITVDGRRREFLLALPDAAAGPAPVVVDLHGFGADAEQESRYSRLAELGPERGFIVATPESANRLDAWLLPIVPGTADAAFVAALLDELERTACADPTREFAAGISNGAGLAAGLVCDLGGRLAGVAPVAGVNILAPCNDPVATTIVAFHGTADPLIPYDGGAPGRDAGPARLQLEPVEATVAAWAERFGCAAPVDDRTSASVRHRAYGGCGAGAVVELYTIEGGGHTWPGARVPVPPLGPTTQEIDASQLLLDRFVTV